VILHVGVVRGGENMFKLVTVILLHVWFLAMCAQSLARISETMVHRCQLWLFGHVAGIPNDVPGRVILITAFDARDGAAPDAQC